MKRKIKDNNFITILGIKINGGVLVAIIIFALFFIFYSVRTIYTKHKLENGKTEIVFAEIIDAGIRTPGGLGVKSKVGYIRFRYFNNGKEVIRSTESFEIRDNIEQYRIGYCIELLISLEDENIYKWNKSKGTFKCQ
jgi:hypothetical protein